MKAPASSSNPGSNEPAEALAFAMLTTPRPIEAYHEDMGPMLWWHWKWFEGSKTFGWANEEPYVGSPLNLGFTVEAHTTTRLITQSNQEHDPEPVIHRIHAGGWPGYHTHFTMIPMPKSPAMPLEQEKTP